MTEAGSYRKGIMQIEGISFGRLVLDGHTFATDLLIYPDGRVQEDWRRERGHRLVLEDISELVATDPDVIVAGTGVNGRMRPDPDLEERLLARGIELQAAPNERASGIFNHRIRTERVGACFHLTC